MRPRYAGGRRDGDVERQVGRKAFFFGEPMSTRRPERQRNTPANATPKPITEAKAVPLPAGTRLPPPEFGRPPTPDGVGVLGGCDVPATCEVSVAVGVPGPGVDVAAPGVLVEPGGVGVAVFANVGVTEPVAVGVFVDPVGVAVGVRNGRVGVGVGVRGVPVGVGVEDPPGGVQVGGGVHVGGGVQVGGGVLVSVGVDVSVDGVPVGGVFVSVGGVPVGVFVLVDVLVGVLVLVDVLVGVLVLVGVSVGVLVSVGVDVSVGVGVAVSPVQLMTTVSGNLMKIVDEPTPPGCV